MYEIMLHSLTGNPEGVIRLEDNAHIPADEANADYRQYLAWLAEQPAPKSTK